FLSLDRTDDFIGKEALLAEHTAGPKRRLVTVLLSGERLAATSEHPWPALDADGELVGEVRVATWSPKHESNLAIALVASPVAGDSFATITPSGQTLTATHHNFFGLDR
ncbi:MAG: hypothetical protein HOF06_01400, partial [Actinobacteria bacterium]|nr:hypothetical protein [Actinomycetota bacterium]MBT5117889.1 hypothetical protein [Actinomycetota bacterium]MBT7378886.1 hypothetical protein [Actinomycetota bacterium]